jgi:DNA repair exonuclease SbcCD ATPase subunit
MSQEEEKDVSQNQENITQNEAEYAGFVDKGTQIVLQEAIQKVLDTFNQADALEDILGYLEEMREGMQNEEDRIREIQQREKQISDKVSALETSITNLLQRIQSLEVQVTRSCETVESFEGKLTSLTNFFEQPPFKRMFGRLENDAEKNEDEEESS